MKRRKGKIKENISRERNEGHKESKNAKNEERKEGKQK